MKRILIVEDEPEIRQLLASYLVNEGYFVSEAEDGVTAIELFSKEKFDLLILDIMIPKIDGYGVCEFVKKHSNVPSYSSLHWMTRGPWSKVMILLRTIM